MNFAAHAGLSTVCVIYTPLCLVLLRENSKKTIGWLGDVPTNIATLSEQLSNWISSNPAVKTVHYDDPGLVIVNLLPLGLFS